MMSRLRSADSVIIITCIELQHLPGTGSTLCVHSCAALSISVLHCISQHGKGRDRQDCPLKLAHARAKLSKPQCFCHTRLGQDINTRHPDGALVH